MPEPRTRLYLVTPPLAAAAEGATITAVLAAGDVACLLLRLAPAAERDRKEIVKAIAPGVQERGTALLVEDARLAAHAGADGVHVGGAGDGFAAALDSLKPDRIVGTGALASRDGAMRAGEAGADYVMFGDAGFGADGPDPDDVVEAVGWWAEIFNVPCVGFARRLDEVQALAAAGAEFVALGDCVWSDPRGPAAAVADAVAAVARAEGAHGPDAARGKDAARGAGEPA